MSVMKEMGRMTGVVRETSIKNAEIAEDFLEKCREASEFQACKKAGSAVYTR